MIKFLNKNFINLFFFLYLISYICGPAVINLTLTLFSIYSLIYIINNKNILPSILLIDRSLKCFLIFFIYICFKELFSENYNFEILSFLRFIIIFIFISIYYNNHNSNVTFNFNILIFILAFLTIDTIIQYFLGYNLFGFEKFQADRLTSMFDDEPIIGSFLLKLTIISSTFIFFYHRKNFFLNSILIFACLAILLSGERMPFLQMLFGFTLIFIFVYRPSLKLFFSISALILIILISIASQPNIKSRYSSTLVGLNNLYISLKDNNEIKKDYLTSHGINDYYLVFNSGTQLWKQNLIFGNGYRDYKNNCFEKLNENLRDGCSTHPHNIYIEILTDHGIIGLIFFLIFIFSLYFEFIKKVKSKKYYGFLITSLIITVPFVTSQSIFSSYYGSIYFLLIFMIKILSSSEINRSI